MEYIAHLFADLGLYNADQIIEMADDATKAQADELRDHEGLYEEDILEAVAYGNEDFYRDWPLVAALYDRTQKA